VAKKESKSKTETDFVVNFTSAPKASPPPLPPSRPKARHKPQLKPQLDTLQQHKHTNSTQLSIKQTNGFRVAPIVVKFRLDLSLTAEFVPCPEAKKSSAKKSTGSGRADSKKKAALQDIAARRQDRTAPKRAHQYRAGEEDEDDEEFDDKDDEGYVDPGQVVSEGEDMDLAEDDDDAHPTPIISEPQTPRAAAPPKKLAADAERSRRVPQTPNFGDVPTPGGPSAFPSPSPVATSHSAPTTPYKEQPTLELDDVKGLQITREKFLKWIDEPFFLKTIKGLFVRCLITPGRNQSQSLYRFAEIVDRCDL